MSSVDHFAAPVAVAPALARSKPQSLDSNEDEFELQTPRILQTSAQCAVQIRPIDCDSAEQHAGAADIDQHLPYNVRQPKSDDDSSGAVSEGKCD